MSANIDKAVISDGLRNAFAKLEERDIKAIANLHISRLRRKLGARAAARIVNVTGNGYKFEA